MSNTIGLRMLKEPLESSYWFMSGISFERYSVDRIKKMWH